MTGSGGTNTACAACKYQRRKCSPDCPLSPYFPPDQPKRFQNVHKLFGVSNILRILKHVDPSKREDTVKSIAYEADTREKDPVHGCLGVITILQNQVTKLKDELALAREQLYILEQQHSFNQQSQMQQIAATLAGNTSVVNVTAAQDSALMQHLQPYGDISTTIPTSNFEDQYLRYDSFDQLKPAPGTFDMGRYIRGDSSPIQQALPLGQVKAEQDQNLRRANMQFEWTRDTTFIDTSGNQAQLVQRDQPLEPLHPHSHALTMRRPGSGLLNLTVTSDSEFRRTSGLNGQNVPEHELRSAGVYLTLTNNQLTAETCTDSGFPCS